MRVLHLIPSLVGGGAERQLANLANELARTGVDVHVGFVHAGPNLIRIENGPVRCHRIECANNHDPLILWRVLRLVRTIRPCVVQTWLPQMDVFGGIAARLCRVPHVLSERSCADAYPRTWKNRLREWIGSGASTVAANSRGGVDYWEGRNAGLPAVVIRNGIAFQATGAAQPTMSDLDLAAQMRIILFAGRLSEEKNLQMLVRALDEVLASRRDCIAILFGEGPLEQVVSLEIGRARAGNRIRLCGYTDELASWMQRADVFVSVSRFEGSPNTVMEAMALRCPLVVSAIPQHREFLDESTALLCDPDSVRDIAASIAATLDDRASAANRATEAHKRAALWTVSAAAMAYLNLYESLLSGKKSTTA